MSLRLQKKLPAQDWESARPCRACGSADVGELMPPASVPLYCNVLWPDRDRAIRAPRGQLWLSECRDCGHVDNQAFDSGLLDYSPDYDNSLHFSGHFSDYAGDLARSLVSRHGLSDGFVVDVGCGRGDFLELLCRLGNNRGRGYDRSCPSDRTGDSGSPRLEFVQDFFTADTGTPPIDLLCCRQVLEHVDYPATFLSEIRRAPGVTTKTVFFFEVPNGDHTFRGDGLWDMIYEHCSYFVPASLAAVVRRAGLAVTAAYPLFSGQYLGIEARPAGPGPQLSDLPVRLAPPPAADGFACRHIAAVAAWRQAAARWAGSQETVVIWGAGSKGVSFLDTIRPATLRFAVDLNPRKHGRFLPGSGVEVIAPERLGDIRPDRVILMNPVYREEVAARLASLGLCPVIDAA